MNKTRRNKARRRKRIKERRAMIRAFGFRFVTANRELVRRLALTGDGANSLAGAIDSVADVAITIDQVC